MTTCRLVPGHEGCVRRVIERELVRRLVLPDAICRADRSGNADAPLAWKLVDDDLALCLTCDFHRNDLVGKVSCSVRNAGAPMALEHEPVLLFARQSQLVATLLPCVAIVIGKYWSHRPS